MYEERIIELKSFDLGSLVRNYRIEKNMTQEQLAELFECSPSTISRIEKGESLPNKRIYETIISYARKVDQSVKTDNDTSLFEIKGHSGLLEALEGRRWEMFEEKLCALKQHINKNLRLRQLYEMAKLLWEIMYIHHMTGVVENDPEKIIGIHNRLSKALAYTISNFPKNIWMEERKLSHTEIVLLNGYAFSSFRKGEKEEAVNILRMLSGILKTSLKEDSQYYKAEAALYNNKAVMAMRIGRHKLASDFLEKGINIAKVHGNLYILITLLQNQTKNHMDLGNEKMAEIKRNAYQSVARTFSEEENGAFLRETDEGTVIMVF